jgi:hypothetical protein
MKPKRLLQFISGGLFFLMNSSGVLHAQALTEAQTNGSRFNSIRTAVPFLLITPDARIGGMGEAGVAIAPDANSIGINPSKIAFLEPQSGFSISYSPWLKNIASDINLGYFPALFFIWENSVN